MVNIFENIEVSENKTFKTKQEQKVDNITSDIKNKKFVTLLYGDAGTGKTYISLTFPAPILFIDTENRADLTKHALFKEKDIKIVEPVSLKTEITKTMDDVFDEVQSLDNLTSAIAEFVKEITEGKRKSGTIVIDSTSDIWSWIQSWMFSKLSKMTTKTGTTRANEDLQTVSSQLDWKMANNKHETIVKVLRSLTSKGIYVVFTAKEKSAPEYVTTKPTAKEKIRAQKDLPFIADVIINLKKEDNKYIGIVEKLGIKSTNEKSTIVEPNFEKIEKLKPIGD